MKSFNDRISAVKVLRLRVSQFKKFVGFIELSKKYMIYIALRTRLLGLFNCIFCHDLDWRPDSPKISAIWFREPTHLRVVSIEWDLVLFHVGKVQDCILSANHLKTISSSSQHRRGAAYLMESFQLVRLIK